jgi:hypothetical protein
MDATKDSICRECFRQMGVSTEWKSIKPKGFAVDRRNASGRHRAVQSPTVAGDPIAVLDELINTHRSHSFETARSKLQKKIDESIDFTRKRVEALAIEKTSSWLK